MIRCVIWQTTRCRILMSQSNTRSALVPNRNHDGFCRQLNTHRRICCWFSRGEHITTRHCNCNRQCGIVFKLHDSHATKICHRIDALNHVATGNLDPRFCNGIPGVPLLARRGLGAWRVPTIIGCDEPIQFCTAISRKKRTVLCHSATPCATTISNKTTRYRGVHVITYFASGRERRDINARSPSAALFPS